MGLHRGCELECGSMPADDLKQLQALLSAAQQQLNARSRTPAQPRTPALTRTRAHARPTPAVPVDAIRYSIAVHREGSVETLDIDDTNRTDEIAALLAFLEQRSGPRQRS